ncbi:hypothetical protein FB451DRAFT_1039424, partial [Mycena latifolia]
IDKSPVASAAPSVAEDPKSVQHSIEVRVWNDRPHSETGIAPCALLYPAFGKFQDIFTGRSAAEVELVDEARLQRAVLTFAAYGRRYYESGLETRDALLPLFNAIFAAHRQSPAWPTVSASSSASLPGLATDEHHNAGQAARMVIDFRCDFHGHNCEAEYEALAYATQSHACATRSHAARYASTRMPALVIIVQGSYICFYALVFLQRPRIVELTPMLGLRDDGASHRALDSLCNAFRAACVLRAEIHADMDALLVQDKAALRPLLEPSFPAITTAYSYPARTEVLSFELTARAHPSADRLLFTATLGPQSVFVKFAQSYSPELHAFCHAAGHAPALLAYDRVPGGWHVIVMEHLQGAAPLVVTDATRQRGYAQVKALVKKFHAAGLVHGDVRCANILAHRGWEHSAADSALGQLQLVDFDWGGRVGEARFPSAMLSSEHRGRELRTTADLVIRREDDLRVLANTFGVRDSENDLAGP